MKNQNEDPFYIGEEGHCLSYIASGLGLFLCFKLIALKEMDLWSVIIIVVIAALLIAHFSESASKKHRQDNQLEREKGIKKNIYDSIQKKQVIPYYLYLRPFDTKDALKVGDYDPDSEVNNPDFKAATRTENLEIFLGRAVAPIKFLAVGRPGVIGASKIETDNKNWKQEVLVLAKHAKIILMLPALRDGTLWEIKQLFHNQKLLSKTIFIMPPKKIFTILDFRKTKFDIPEEWRKIRNHLLGEHIQLPGYTPKGLMFTMTKKGRMKRKLPVSHWSLVEEIKHNFNQLISAA